MSAVLPRIFSVPEVECSTTVVNHTLRFDMSRVSKWNAVTAGMLAHLVAATNRVNTHEKLNAIVISSSSPKVFCTRLEDTGEETVERARRVIDGLAKAKVPSFALIDGQCVGIGLELALAVDFRIVTRSALFSLPQTQQDAIPGLTHQIRGHSATISARRRVSRQTHDLARPQVEWRTSARRWSRRFPRGRPQSALHRVQERDLQPRLVCQLIRTPRPQSWQKPPSTADSTRPSTTVWPSSGSTAPSSNSAASPSRPVARSRREKFICKVLVFDIAF